MKVGDWGFVTGNYLFHIEMWKQRYPQNVYGKVIKENKSYSRSTGKLLVIDYTVRCYSKEGQYHRIVTEKYFKPIKK